MRTPTSQLCPELSHNEIPLKKLTFQIKCQAPFFKAFLSAAKTQIPSPLTFLSLQIDNHSIGNHAKMYVSNLKEVTQGIGIRDMKEIRHAAKSTSKSNFPFL